MNNTHRMSCACLHSHNTMYSISICLILTTCGVSYIISSCLAAASYYALLLPVPCSCCPLLVPVLCMHAGGGSAVRFEGGLSGLRLSAPR